VGLEKFTLCVGTSSQDGVRRGDPHAAGLQSIRLKDGGGYVVCAGRRGEEIAANAVVSGPWIPKRTFLIGGCDPGSTRDLHADEEFPRNGTCGEVHLALVDLPAFRRWQKTRWAGRIRAALSGRIHILPEIDYLERAFVMVEVLQYSKRRTGYDVTYDFWIRSWRRREASCSVYRAIWRRTIEDWKLGDGTDGLGPTVIQETLAQYAAVISELLRCAGDYANDLECEYDFGRGIVFHGDWRWIDFYKCGPCWIGRGTRRHCADMFLCGMERTSGNGLTESAVEGGDRIIHELAVNMIDPQETSAITNEREK